MDKLFWIWALAATLVAFSTRAADQVKEVPPEADKEWQEILKVTKPPAPPAEWNGKQPSQDQLAEFKKKAGLAAVVAAEKARAFYKKYPDHPNAADAQKKEKSMLVTAINLGQTNQMAQLKANPSLSDKEKFQIKMQELNQKALAQKAKGREAVIDTLDKGYHEILKEFPKENDIFAELLMLARNSDIERRKRLATEIAKSDAPEELREEAESILKKLGLLGKPPAIKFTAVDGRQVDLAALKGKVVLIDFWATWCPACVEELPEVKEVYKKYNPKGFEIIGISFDEDKREMLSFIKSEKMPWPQYFDGAKWKNKIGREFGIESLPSMWLVDKEGNLADLEADEDLPEKVQKLLAK